jgi:hypothetical protein
MFDDELYVCPKCGASRQPGEFGIACARCRKEKEMASRKKPVDPVPPSPDDVAKLKQEMAAGAKAVTDAAAKMPLSIPMDISMDTQWQQAQDRTRRMDEEFTNMGDVEVRVLQLGPNGQLMDVSDRVNPRDLLPEQIEGFQSSDGSVRLPRRSNGEIDHDAALDFMSQLIGVNRRIRKAETESTAAMREMEVLLAESDRLLAKLSR